ncbi:MAG TPA: SdrD B-like domain-containing protein [Kiritimatiellia bacterium]|nr:SdrD B-like domain-containing protein [Kiritimatiellia bacterium]HMP33887.1 SdrD B-like domain-containing protein [Kiritimatiellia bacterium]
MVEHPVISSRSRTGTLRRARLLVAAWALGGWAAVAPAQTVVQTFFMPFDEAEVNVALNTIDNFGGAIGSTIRSTISIVGGITNTVIYWDHWEDGYEDNILAPTQATTQVWGDNNPANGIPPSFGVDRVNEGSIISLINDIPIPRIATNIYFDARDKMSVTRWVAVSRYLYAPNPGEVLADSAQVYDRSKYGFNFRAPVGINTGTNQMFEYTAMHVSAGYNSTVVQIDTDADGNFDETVFLNEGENYVTRFTFQGAQIQASKPVQAHLITGDIGSNYEMRFFELFPSGQWDNNYYTPVHSIGTIATEIYLFNPNQTNIDVVCATQFATSTVNIAANSTAIYRMPTNRTGGNFYSVDGSPFVPVSATDAGQQISGNQAYDWGAALVPVRALTTVSIVPWAPGAGGNPLSSNNGNPIWLTAESNTTVYVDYDGDPLTGPLIDPFGRRYNFSTNLVRLQSIRISDNTDNDQTGIRLYTLDGIRFSTVWGQDPAIALPGNPYLDMGAAVFPFPTVPAVKEWALIDDLNEDGVVNPGDAIQFTIFVVNVGYSDANNVVVYDSGASNTTYTLGSSFVNGTNILDDAVPPFLTEFPFDEIGYNVGYIAMGRTATVSYIVRINDPFPTNTDGVVNGVYVDNETEVFVPVPIPGFTMSKTSPTNLFYPGDTISYTLDIVSTANVFQTGVQLIDQLPSTVTYVPGSTRVVVFGPFTGNFLDRFDLLNEYNGNNGALRWNSDWQEIGEANGAGAGSIQVIVDSGDPSEQHMLRIQGSDSSISIGAMRRADLARFTNVTLRFSYRRDSMDSSSEVVSVSASGNGGSSWTVLQNIAGTGVDDATYITVSNLSLNAFRTTNFALRFLANSTMNTGDRLWIDNVEILASGNTVTNVGGAPPLLFSNYGVASGQALRVTFNATINGNIAVSQIVNRAFINSFASPAPLEAAATNYAILPQRSLIAGWVRNDLNADGNVGNTNYPGINGVPITLYTDPNRDGNPADGVIVASTYSTSNGYFELGYFLSNSYVILQTDLLNWRSTGDSDGGNSNLIALVTASGVNFTNNIFLDTRLANIRGKVGFDADADGDLLETNAGIAGVTVRLFTDPNQDGGPADGVLVTSVVTDVNGNFQFSNINTGYYVLVEVDPPGMFSTADSDGINDNLIGLYLAGGIDSENHLFLDASSGLHITKTASPPGIWFPGLLARYAITVVNTGSYTHTGLTIEDHLGIGLIYSPGSAYLTFVTNVANYTGFTVRDNFSSASFSANNGTAVWSSNWVEENDNNSASSGLSLITGGRLRINNLSNNFPRLYRDVDLGNAAWAAINFRYEASNSLVTTDSAVIEVSADGGENYTIITNITGFSGSRSGTETFDITPWASAETRVRVRINNGYTNSTRFFRLDHIEVAYSNVSYQTLTNVVPVAPPPVMLSNYSLAPGQTISIVFTSEVDIVYGVTNRACVTSTILTNPLCTAVTNSVDPQATPDRISGQVRYDFDGDGNLLDADVGLRGVTIELFTDPNADGNPADGVLLSTTVTDMQGYYIFGDLVSGRYVVVQTDLSGYLSTADSQGANDNRIAVHLTGGVDSRDNDFLDWAISGLSIEKLTSGGDIVIPGELITYSIIVSNVRNTTASGVSIKDQLPAGMSYVPASGWAIINGIISTNSTRDLFNARAYTNSDGNVTWLAPWTETNDTGGATSGSILVTNDFGPLRLRLSNLNRWVQRQANISGGQSVTLSYFYRRQSLETGEFATVEISTNGLNWVELARHGFESGGSSSQSDASYQFVSTNITPYASTNTFIRFRTAPSGNMNTADFVWFDDISFDFGTTGSGSIPTFSPPFLVTNQTLAAGGSIRVTFTAAVTFADTIVNTAIVFTAVDTNGLRAYASNLVGNLSLTQGYAVVQGNQMGVRVGWSHYKDDNGQVIKDYDVLYVDDPWTGFNPAMTSQWAWAGTVRDGVFSDFGGTNRLPPMEMGNRMRFYRAAFKGTWGMNKSPRYASKEIYVAKCVMLNEGENFISLFMIPDKNNMAWIFGTNMLPRGSSMANSTRIEWYAPNSFSEATNVVWLSNAGVWQYATGGIANTMPVPLHQGFNLIVPPGAGPQELILVGRVPTNTSAAFGHQVSIVASGNYNVVSYNIPYRVRLIDSGLKQAGFAGVAANRPFNPNYSDEIRILRRGGGSLQTPEYRILMNSSGQFQFWSGGNGVADNFQLDPDDALIIYTRKSTTNFNWNITLPYPTPTEFMSP